MKSASVPQIREESHAPPSGKGAESSKCVSGNLIGTKCSTRKMWGMYIKEENEKLYTETEILINSFLCWAGVINPSQCDNSDWLLDGKVNSQLQLTHSVWKSLIGWVWEYIMCLRIKVDTTNCYMQKDTQWLWKINPTNHRQPLLWAWWLNA